MLSQYDSNTTLRFFYGTDGVIGFQKNNEVYLYRRNLLGDIIGIYDSTNTLVAKYAYNAWGEHKVLNPDGTDNNSDTFIGNINPLRYRGYYYDADLGLYYLMTRYYDPEVGRFISADGIEYLVPETIGGLNLFAYCNNNPVMGVDPDGTDRLPWWAKLLIGISFVVAGAVVTAVTAGTGVGFAAAFGSALVTSLKAVAISTAISAGLSVVDTLARQDWSHLGENLLTNVADGVMWGGIFAGGAQILSGGFHAYAEVASRYGKMSQVKRSFLFSPDRLKSAGEIAKIAQRGQKYYDYGGTIIRFGSFVHLDASTKSLLHLAAFGYQHIPVGTIAAGIIGWEV